MVDDPTYGDLREVLRSLAAHLEWQRACGSPWLPRGAQRSSGPSAATAGVAEPPRAAAPPRSAPPPAAPASTPSLFGERGVREASTLAALQAHIGDCQRCKLARL